MRKFILTLCLITTFGLPAAAQGLIDTYTAEIGENDYYNSGGDRLGTAAGILQQDRANFHKFGIRDRRDTGDSYFTTAKERSKISEAVRQSNLPEWLTSGIVSGSIRLLRVEIYGFDESGVDYLELFPQN